jgi:hypothetical protein
VPCFTPGMPRRCINIAIVEPSISQEEQSSFSLSNGDAPACMHAPRRRQDISPFHL